jgi:integration host factor subunit beta
MDSSENSTSRVARSELAKRLAKRSGITVDLSESVVKTLVKSLSQSLLNRHRIEIRDFGCFLVRSRKPRKARNPKTGETIQTEARYGIGFKPGKELRERVDQKLASK